MYQWKAQHENAFNFHEACIILFRLDLKAYGVAAESFTGKMVRLVFYG